MDTVSNLLVFLLLYKTKPKQSKNLSSFVFIGFVIIFLQYFYMIYI